MCACLSHDLAKKVEAQYAMYFVLMEQLCLLSAKKVLRNCQIHHKFTNKLHRNANLSEAADKV